MAKAPSAIILDFETHAIQSRPVYPPEPVGVAIKWPKDRKSKYWAWGHPVGNNCSLEEGSRAVREVWASGLPVVFHNSKFDMDVAETHLGCPPLPWERIHDTMFLLFLTNPHLKQLGLKPASAVLLGMAPEERDAVKEWLIENRLIPRNASDSKVGENLSKAPGDLVGKYADGDVLRTLKLFQQFYPDICDRGMLKAYDRERQLVQILLRNEREGIRVDGPRLEKDLRELYRPAMINVEGYIRRRLKSKELNIDSNEELADALEQAGLAEGFAVTKTGKRSVAKESLQAAIKDKKILQALGYRSRLATCVNMFMEPWLEIGKHNAGMLQTTWHQVRQGGGGGGNFGARTGRLITSDPNLLNLSKDFEGRNDGYSHPTCTTTPLPPLPLVRKYMLPDKGGVWAHRDFSGQELRVLGHFENGVFLEAYRADPHLDPHEYVRQKILEITGIECERPQTKTMNFLTIYGGGLGLLAERLGIDVDRAKRLKNAQMSVLPGLKALEKEIKDLGRSDECIVTWGGRQYFAEEPMIIDGRTRTFEYKLLNYIIQGSAADCTKEAVIRYDAQKRDGRFLVTVYDELNISAPKKALKSEMAILRDVMEGIEFDVPMLSDGKIGNTWGDLEKYKEAPFNMEAWLATHPLETGEV